MEQTDQRPTVLVIDARSSESGHRLGGGAGAARLVLRRLGRSAMPIGDYEEKGPPNPSMAVRPFGVP